LHTNQVCGLLGRDLPRRVAIMRRPERRSTEIVAMMGSLTAFGIQVASGSFVVLSGSQYRRSVPSPGGKPNRVRDRSERLQSNLARRGVTDWKAGRFLADLA
jgi:hypothetical protein